MLVWCFSRCDLVCSGCLGVGVKCLGVKDGKFLWLVMVGF